jgi:hypothetical protein
LHRRPGTRTSEADAVHRTTCENCRAGSVAGFAHVLPAAPGDAGCWPVAMGRSLCWAGHASACPRIACTAPVVVQPEPEPTPAPMAPRNPRQPKSNA